MVTVTYRLVFPCYPTYRLFSGRLLNSFNEIPSDLGRLQHALNRTFWLIVTLLSVPEFAFTLPLIPHF